MAASFQRLAGVASAPDGSLYIADVDSIRVRRVTPDGMIYAFAGNGTSGFGGDGGPAVQAQLNFPSGVAVNAQGEVFIGDASNLRVRKVSTGGIITTVAGTGAGGWPVDGKPAISSDFPSTNGLAFDPDGSLLVSSWSAVFKITPDGLVYHIAGTGGTNSFGGDGGLATEGGFANLAGMAVNATGQIFLADEDNHRVRRLRADRAARPA